MLLIRVYAVTLKGRKTETKSSIESYSPDQQVTLYSFADLSTLPIPKVGN